ncbi:hypothetical protein HK104_005219 [Borealophlyctis nickersoniae]|nr:hypothetical protein HK104_005219 [Borealophlyctis nickersoniae]
MSEQRNVTDAHRSVPRTGGKVFVFTGIIPIVQDEDGMAAVLGHETAHQIARHSAEKLSYMKILLVGQVLLSVFFDTSFLVNKMLLEFGLLLPFSRKMEAEADYIGLKLMAQACYDPRAAIRLWERMKQAHKMQPPAYLSTHPSTEYRIKKIKEWLPEALETYQNSDCNQTSDMFYKFGDAFNRKWAAF